MNRAQSIVAAINARLGAAGLSVVAHEPTAIHPPTAYTLITGVEYSASGGMVAVCYNVQVRLCLLWQQSAIAEQEALTWLESIPTLLGGGVLPDTGGARLSLSGAELGFVTLSGVKYRTLDFRCRVEAGVIREGVC